VLISVDQLGTQSCNPGYVVYSIYDIIKPKLLGKVLITRYPTSGVSHSTKQCVVC